MRWIRGLEHSKGILCMIAPTWCLELVLVALTKDPFEPIVTYPLKYLTWKTAVLAAITSTHSASEMHALSCKAPYLMFSNVGVMLFTRLGFFPRVVTKASASYPIVVPACTTRKIGQSADTVRRALNKCLQRTSDVRYQGTTQIVIAYSRWDKDKPISKQQLSKWLVECLRYAYDRNDLPTADGVKGH